MRLPVRKGPKPQLLKVLVRLNPSCPGYERKVKGDLHMNVWKHTALTLPYIQLKKGPLAQQEGADGGHTSF